MNSKTEKSAQTYYDILGVTSDSAENTIKVAYKKLALKKHPDKGGDAEEFKIIQNAYEILKSADTREEYDRGLRSSPNSVVITSPVDASETPASKALLKLILDNAKTLPVDQKEIAKMKKLSERGLVMRMITRTNREEQISVFQAMLLNRLEDQCKSSHIIWLVGTEKAAAYRKALQSSSLSDLIALNQRMLSDINEALGTLEQPLPQRPTPITNLLKASEAYTATTMRFLNNLKIMLKSEPYRSNQSLQDDIQEIMIKEEGKSIDQLRLVERRLLTFEIQHIADTTHPLKTLWSSLLEEDVNPIRPSPTKMADLASWIAEVQGALKEPLKQPLRDNAVLLPNVDVSTLDQLSFHTLVRLNKALDCNSILAGIHSLCQTGADKQYIPIAIESTGNYF